MTRFQIDRLIGQTPCLCANIETWHLECFAGKSDAAIKKGYNRAYATVRRWIATQRITLAKSAIASARGKASISTKE